MKKYFICCFSLFWFGLFAQVKEKRSYIFDTYEHNKIKDYKNNIFIESHIFSNSKDSTYSLNLKYGKKNEAILIIKKEKVELITFDLNFRYSQIENLNQLENSTLHNQVFSSSATKKKKQTKLIIEIEYTNDTINNQVIVHIKQLKGKKKKIINENYYFLSNNNSQLEKDVNNKLIKILEAKHNLTLVENLNVDRVLFLQEGKLHQDISYLKKEKVNFLFTFEIDKIKNETTK
jgi:hypothetical protein